MKAEWVQSPDRAGRASAAHASAGGALPCAMSCWRPSAGSLSPGRSTEQGPPPQHSPPLLHTIRVRGTASWFPSAQAPSSLSTSLLGLGLDLVLAPECQAGPLLQILVMLCFALPMYLFLANLGSYHYPGS